MTSAIESQEIVDTGIRDLMDSFCWPQRYLYGLGCDSEEGSLDISSSCAGGVDEGWK